VEGLVLQPAERGRLVQPESEPEMETDQPEGPGDREGHPPAPGLHAAAAQQGGHQCDQPRGTDVPGERAQLQEAAVETASLVGAYSAMKVDAPPVEKPWTSLKRISRTGAQKPIAAYEGISPMAQVPIAIMIIVRARTFLRPILSPIGPKTIPPIGRTRNDTAKVANDDSSCTVSLPDGKKTWPMVTARQL